MVLAVAPVVASGCGGSDNGDMIRAAESVILPVAREHVGRMVTPPTYLQADVRRPVLGDAQVVEEGEGLGRVRGTVQVTVVLTPKLDKARHLRVIRASGAQMTVRATAEAFVSRTEDGTWIADRKAVRLEPRPVVEPSPDDEEAARRLAVEAVRALVTFTRDLASYNRAQRRFYATNPSGRLDFNQPGFDPAPALVLDREVQDRYGETGGPAWTRTNDGGEDDLALAEVLSPDTTSFSSSCGLRLTTMRPKTVGGELRSDDGGGASSFVLDRVEVSGLAVVELGAWQCDSWLSDPETIESEEAVVRYEATVSRMRFGENRAWFVSRLMLGEGAGGLYGSPDDGPYTIEQAVAAG